MGHFMYPAHNFSISAMNDRPTRINLRRPQTVTTQAILRKVIHHGLFQPSQKPSDIYKLEEKDVLPENERPTTSCKPPRLNLKQLNKYKEQEEM